MKTNPLLEELWQVKDDLARETCYDIHRIFADLRAAEAQQPGLLLRSANDLRRYVAQQTHPHEAASALAVKEQPTPVPPAHE